MGSQYKEDCPFCADNARKRREEIEAAHREAFPDRGTTDCAGGSARLGDVPNHKAD